MRSSLDNAQEQEHDQNNEDQAYPAHWTGAPTGTIAVTATAKEKDDQYEDNNRGRAHVSSLAEWDRWQSISATARCRLD